MSVDSSQLVQRLWNYCNVLLVEKEGEDCKLKGFIRYCRELIYTKEPLV